jgi:hypothetical protein
MPSHRGRRCGGQNRTPPIHQTHHATLSNLLPVAAEHQPLSGSHLTPCSLRQAQRRPANGADVFPLQHSPARVGSRRSKSVAGSVAVVGMPAFSHSNLAQKKNREDRRSCGELGEECDIARTAIAPIPPYHRPVSQSSSFPAFQCPVSVFLHTPSTEAPSPHHLVRVAEMGPVPA